MVAGTRIRVATILGCYRQGLGIEEIVQQYAPLKPADVHDALAYAYDHIEEIEGQGEAKVTLGGRPFTIKKQFLDDIRAHNVLGSRVPMPRFGYERLEGGAAEARSWWGSRRRRAHCGG